jgi:hypothetical protein
VSKSPERRRCVSVVTLLSVGRAKGLRKVRGCEQHGAAAFPIEWTGLYQQFQVKFSPRTTDEEMEKVMTARAIVEV